MRFTKLMHNQRDHSPTVTTTLENITEQLNWLRENWYEGVFRHLRLGLVKCYMSAFEHSDNVADTPIPPQLFSFVRKMVTSFGISMDTLANQGKYIFCLKL